MKKTRGVPVILFVLLTLTLKSVLMSPVAYAETKNPRVERAVETITAALSAQGYQVFVVAEYDELVIYAWSVRQWKPLGGFSGVVRDPNLQDLRITIKPVDVREK